MCRALPATASGWPTSRSARFASRWSSCPSPITRARPRSRVQLPALTRTNRPLEADVILKLRESGGRTIERTITLPVDMKSERIGIKQQFTGGQVAEGDMARFEAIMLASRRQANRGQGPEMGGAAPRPALAVVQPRRLLELRVGDTDTARGSRLCRRRRGQAGRDRNAPRLGSLPPGGERVRRLGLDLQHHLQRRLLGRRRRRQLPRHWTSRSTSRPTRSARRPA